MKRSLLVFLLLFLVPGVAAAEVQVYFSPDSGFLRVQGEVVMEPSSTTPSFMLFPGAQITELWADELMDYKIDRSSHGTIVYLSIRQARPQNLNFAYEGFIELQGAELLLDRNTLWFPEFSFPIERPQVVMELPTNWELEKLHSPVSMYPIFTIRDTRLVGNEEAPPSEVPVMDEYVSRIRMQVSRLTTAINQRNKTEIESLLSPTLKEAGLAQYLAELPRSFGQLASELRDPFTIIFSTNRSLAYKASVVWQERGGRLELQSFQLRPLGAQLPSELLGSTAEFINDLRLAVQASDQEQILRFLDADIAQGHNRVLEFLLSLNAAATWSVEHTILDPFMITVYVPHTEGTKLLLKMGLTPGEHSWLIHTLEIVPVG